jgi:hypothetical protein
MTMIGDIESANAGEGEIGSISTRALGPIILDQPVQKEVSRIGK